MSCYRHVADLVYDGRLSECYREVDRLIRAGLVRQIENPYDRRQRCLALTQLGARRLSLPPNQARATSRVLRESIRQADVCACFIRGGLRPENVLFRDEALSRFRLKPQRSGIAFGIKDGEAVHFVYVRHSWSTLSALVQSIAHAPARVQSHIVVCMAESTLRRNLKLLLARDIRPVVRIVSLKEIPALIKALARPVFGVVVSDTMPQVISGGHLSFPPEKEPFLLAWESPTCGQIRLVDARLGDLAAFRQLKYSSDHGLPTTVFVQCREQAERIASMHRFHEALWVVICDKEPEEALFRVRPDGLVPVNGGGGP